jgi:hypothetical protein
MALNQAHFLLFVAYVMISLVLMLTLMFHQQYLTFQMDRRLLSHHSHQQGLFRQQLSHDHHLVILTRSGSG